MPACPANYERLTIPAGVAGAGTLLQSCYRVITAAAAVNYIDGSVSTSHWLIRQHSLHHTYCFVNSLQQISKYDVDCVDGSVSMMKTVLTDQ
jgi:hypothetical protein